MAFMSAFYVLVVQHHVQATGGILISILDLLSYYKLTGKGAFKRC